MASWVELRLNGSLRMELTKYSYLLVAFGGHAQVYITLVCMNACTTGRLIALINTPVCALCLAEDRLEGGRATDVVVVKSSAVCAEDARNPSLLDCKNPRNSSAKRHCFRTSVSFEGTSGFRSVVRGSATSTCERPLTVESRTCVTTSKNNTCTNAKLTPGSCSPLRGSFYPVYVR